ncbi:uncharacterized protein LOC127842356 isoform X2 [Dreissena polymorpha]|nr:uncharacterized protein LOC127842356 isoform X2 [Dreissena polymorpha]
MCYSFGWGRYNATKCTNYFSSAGVVCNEKRLSSSSAEEPELMTDDTQRESIITTEVPVTSRRTTWATTERPYSHTTTATPSPASSALTTEATTTAITTTATTTTPKQTATTTPPQPTTTTTTPKPTTTTTATSSSTSTPATTKPPAPSLTSPPAYNQWIFNREMWRYYFYRSDGSFITSRPDPRYFQQSSSTTKLTTTTTTTTSRPTRRSEENSIYRNYNNPVYNTLGGDNPNAIDRMAPQEIRRHESSHSHNHMSMKEGYVQDQPLIADAAETPAVAYGEEQAREEEEVVATSKPVVPKIEVPDYSDFRLVGGRNFSGFREGRLEVRLAGSNTWGVVCGDKFNLRAAIVVCRHFNAGHARTVHKADQYGGSNMDKVVAEMVCTGREERLEDCRMTPSELTPGKEACSRPQSVAGVICETRLPDLVPELKVIQESAFLQDRYLYYLQCAYEEKCLSSSANELYGTPSWAYARRRLLHFSTIAKNIGTADFRPDVDRSRWEWHACHQHYHSMEAFSHYDIVDQHGNKVAEGHKASFCLEDSSCDRGVHPKYECRGFGHQGISVGCQDSYLADIDCQWIDVTDVKPGMYTLKIELNPNMKVPEISFDNNVARCNLYFNTYQARVYNCTLDSLL